MRDELRRLVAQLTEAASRASDHSSLAGLNPESSQYRQTAHREVDMSPDVSAFADALTAAMGWPRTATFHTRDSPSSSASRQMDLVAAELVALARYKSSEEALETFDRLLARNAVDCLEVWALWGLHPSKPIDLGNGLPLLALSDVPPSLPGDHLLGVPEDIEAFRISSFTVHARPRATLVRSFTHGPIVNPSGHYWEPFEFPTPGSRLIDDAVRALVLLEDSPVVVSSWYQNDEDLP